MIRTVLFLAVLLMSQTLFAARIISINTSLVVRLADGAVGSNMLRLSPLVVGYCHQYHAVEQHLQTSMVDTLVSEIDLSADGCIPNLYFIEYEYYFLHKSAKSHYCAYRLLIRQDRTRRVPRARIVGDCDFKVTSQKTLPGRYIYTIKNKSLD